LPMYRYRMFSGLLELLIPKQWLGLKRTGLFENRQNRLNPTQFESLHEIHLPHSRILISPHSIARDRRPDLSVLVHHVFHHREMRRAVNRMPALGIIVHLKGHCHFKRSEKSYGVENTELKDISLRGK
jgi:hypothetical protein